MATIDLGKIKQVFRGTYNNATAYAVDDLVVFTDGSVTSTYICTTASTGNNPSSGGTAHANWAFVAKGQASSPTTTQGDLIVRGASADARLAIGTAGQFVKVNSGANGLEYGTVPPSRTVSAETDTSTGSQYYAFTGIDTTITRFDVIFRKYSNAGNQEVRLQLGNASGYKTSGYEAAAGFVRSTTGTKVTKTAGFDSYGLDSANYVTTGVYRCWRGGTGANSRWFNAMEAYSTGVTGHYFFSYGHVDLQDLNSIRFGGDGGTGDGGGVTLVTYA